MSSLLIPPFQIACTYVSLSNIRVNAFGFHVACDHCSPICSSTTPAIQLQNLARTYMKTPFLYSILAIRKTERLWTIFFSWTWLSLQIHPQQMSNQETEDVLYWRLGILNCTWCHDSKRWDRNQLGMVESTFELQLLTTSWSLWILNRNTEMN